MSEQENRRTGERRKHYIPVAVLITAIGMAATGAWALKSEISNYRLQNVTTRLKSHEDSIMLLMEADSEIEMMHQKEITEIRLRLQKLEDNSQHIKDRVEEILEIQRNGN